MRKMSGWATVISQLISGLLCLLYIIWKFPILHLCREDLIPRRSCMQRLMVMGFPMGMQYSITAIGSILLQTAVNGLSVSAVAAMTAGNKVSMLATCPFEAMGTTAATFAGQNLGAGKPERVHRGVKDCALLGIVYSVVICGALYLFGQQLAELFLDTTDATAIDQVLPLSQRFLMANALFYIPLMFVNLLRFTIQGLGYSNLAVFAGVFEMVARGVFGLCLVPVFGYDAVCFANPAAWIMADIFLFPAYFSCIRKQRLRFESKAALEQSGNGAE